MRAGYRFAPYAFPEQRWDLHTGGPVVRDGRGPERVVTDQPDRGFRRRPVGFRPSEREPEVWEGDDS